ncbi:Guanine nucleotide-binding protein G(t) subunit alpha-2 [Physocladia obscura]|uniref:Guanine nucleotide-binding protein G(T) subunit alpha-2 n=1 Tax=Physocladia obscura TaxID=109957 RepID=A0AAD5XAG8_9FUNG|nr:Guanine nucleotide-binding protein G(t) subunit alpha-2 [Physocladia obscura]
MGNACSGKSQEAAAASAADIANSKEIDKQLKKEEEANMDTAKLLLLGTGETGKSTILKQMRLINGVTFTEDEYIGFRSAIFMNIITCAKSLIYAMDTLKIPYGFQPPPIWPVIDETPLSPDSLENVEEEDPESAERRRRSSENRQLCSKHNDPIAILARQQYANIDPEKGQLGPVADAATVIRAVNIRFGFVKGETLPTNIVEAVRIIWKDAGIHFLNDLDRVCNPEYMPSEQDILNARMMTTSISETRFEVQGVTFRVFDVGGQRSQRKKWAPYFDDVRAIIYLVAMNSYDQVCFEDSSANRMTESLNVFKSMCNHPMFKSTAMILFMNKIDLFRAKLETAMIANHFSEFQGPNTYERGSEFFARQFLTQNKNPEKKIYVHFTWATDTKQIKKILTMVNEIILSSNMASIGLM